MRSTDLNLCSVSFTMNGKQYERGGKAMRRTIAAVMLVLIMISSLAGCTTADTQVVTLRPTEKPTATQRLQTVFEASEEPAETEPVTEEEPEKASEATPEPKDETATEAPTATPEPTPVPEVSSASHFYLKQESEKVRKAFDVIYAGVLAHKKSIELPENVDEDTLNRVQWLLRYDCPELFWLSQLTSFVYVDGKTDSILSVDVDYIMREEEAKLAQKKLDAIVDPWIEKTGGMTDYEKELYAHDQIVKRCAYSSSGKHDGTAYGAIVNGKARCQGYANALGYVLRRMGIESACLYGSAVNSEGKTESHAWNLVKIDGSWTLVDATWNDAQEERWVNHAYFNVTDALLNQTHTRDGALKAYSIPECSSMKKEYCKMSGAYVSADEDAKKALTAYLVKYLKGNAATDCIRFATAEQFKEADAAMQECIQAAADESGVYPENGVYFSKYPQMNYIHFE